MIKCNTIQYHMMICNTMQCRAITSNTIRCHARQCKTMLYTAISCNRMSDCGMHRNTIWYNTIQFGWHNINWIDNMSPSTHGRWHGLHCRADLWNRHTAVVISKVLLHGYCWCCQPWNIILYNAIPWDTKRYRNIKCNTLKLKGEQALTKTWAPRSAS